MASWERTWSFLKGFLGVSWVLPGGSWGLPGGFLGGRPGNFNCDIVDGPYCKMYRRSGMVKKEREWYQSKPSKVEGFTLTGPTFVAQMVGSKLLLLAPLFPWALRHNTKGRSLKPRLAACKALPCWSNKAISSKLQFSHFGPTFSMSRCGI